MSIKKLFTIREIEPNEANAFQIVRHYLNKKASCLYSYGLFNKQTNEMLGVVLYGNPSTPKMQDICGIENRGEVVELTRLWVSDSCPRNSESFFISNTLKRIKHKIVVSFADPEVNHIGYVYQASNFLYTGKSERKGRVISIKNSDIHNKTLWKKYGTAAKIREVFGAENVVYVPYVTKHRYVYIKDKKLLSSLIYEILPYPKQNLNPTPDTWKVS